MWQNMLETAGYRRQFKKAHALCMPHK